MPLFPSQTSLVLAATTGVSGYSLVNDTGTIISWTAPADGELHRYKIFAQQSVTSAMTAGELAIVFKSVDGTTETQQFSAGGFSDGVYGPGSFSWLDGLIEAGSTITLEQFSAMTAGTSTFWAEIWAG